MMILISEQGKSRKIWGCSLRLFKIYSNLQQFLKSPKPPKNMFSKICNFLLIIRQLSHYISNLSLDRSIFFSPHRNFLLKPVSVDVKSSLREDRLIKSPPSVPNSWLFRPHLSRSSPLSLDRDHLTLFHERLWKFSSFSVEKSGEKICVSRWKIRKGWKIGSKVAKSCRKVWSELPPKRIR